MRKQPRAANADAAEEQREKRAADRNGPTGSGSEFFCHAPVLRPVEARELRSIILQRWRMPSWAFKKMRSSGARPAEGHWQQKNETRDLGPTDRLFASALGFDLGIDADVGGCAHAVELVQRWVAFA